MSYQTVIGLEIHLELKTESKMFCPCSADHFGQKPNTATCPVCLGLPGALPYPNQKAIDWTLLFGLGLGCSLPKKAKFDRKHYFYPDLPKGYQISQYDQPFCRNGQVEITDANSKPKTIRVNRVHLEEDAGKLVHQGNNTLVDLNRAGVPLVEIVSEPDLSSIEEAEQYAHQIQRLARWLGVSDADMEKGQLRLELNLSLRKEDQKELPNYRVEVKNINSFRFLKKAAEYEIKRQAKLLDQGVEPDQETRGYDESSGKTFVQRSKEEAHDYRYFPEPDIPPFEWSDQKLAEIKAQLPVLPGEIEAKLVKLGVKPEAASLLVRERASADFVLKAIRLGEKEKVEPKTIANQLVNRKPDLTKISPQELVTKLAKKAAPSEIDEDELIKIAQKVVADSPDETARYRAGKQELINYFVGLIMRETRGQADANQARKIAEKVLKSN